MRTSVAFFRFCVCLLVVVVTGREKNLRRRRDALALPIKRCTLFWRYEDTPKGDGRILECEMRIDGRLRRYPIIGFDEKAMTIQSGDTDLVSSNFEAVNNTIQVQGDNWKLEFSNNNNHHHDVPSEEQQHQTHLFHSQTTALQRTTGTTMRSMGNRRTVVVHIRTEDSQTPYTVQKLSDVVFGTHGDVENLKSRINACSYGQMTIAPSTLEGIQDGVFPVDLRHMVAKGADRDILRDAALDKLRDTYGEELGDVFDHVMICIPPGVNNPFIAYAWGSDFLSVYYGEWCGSLSAQVHEIGHNVGLTHSGKGAKDGTCKYCSYADQSGMMGFTYNEDNGPKMCFNSAKSWQLGWYSDKSVEINPLKDTWNGKLVGIADYGKKDLLEENVHYILLKLEAPNQNMSYFIGFNRKTGINEETKEGADEVLVTSHISENGVPQNSYLEASLKSGKQFTIDNFDESGETVTIKVNYIWKAGSLWSADVDITSPSASLERPPTMVPSGSPTAVTSLAPSMSPSVKASLTPTWLPSFNPTDNPTVVKSSSPSLSAIPTTTTRPSSNPTMTMKPSGLPSQIPSMTPSTFSWTHSNPKGISDEASSPNNSTGKMILAGCLSVFGAAMMMTAFYLAKDRGVLDKKSRRNTR